MNLYKCTFKNGNNWNKQLDTYWAKVWNILHLNTFSSHLSLGDVFKCVEVFKKQLFFKAYLKRLVLSSVCAWHGVSWTSHCYHDGERSNASAIWRDHWGALIHHMMTSSSGNIFRVTGPLCREFTGSGEFPTQRPVTRSFDVFFDLRLNKRLS